MEWISVDIEPMPKDRKILAFNKGKVSSCWWKLNILGEKCFGGAGWHYGEHAMPSHWCDYDPPK